MIERIERESQRLDALIEELLTLHRLTAGAGLARERVDVIELLQAITEDADFEAKASERSVRIDAPGVFVAEVNGELVYSAYENVIRNALKFSPPGSAVEIDARTSSDGSELVKRVRDRGPGVPAQMHRCDLRAFRSRGRQRVPARRGPGAGHCAAGHGPARRRDRRCLARDGGGLEVTLRLPSGLSGSLKRTYGIP